MPSVDEVEVDQEGRNLIAGFEATILHVYNDQVGIPTVCTGHVVRPEDQVWIADGVTREECDRTLSKDLGWVTRSISDNIHVKLNQEMVNALSSLIINIGSGNFAKSSVKSLLNLGKYEDAAHAFELWKFANVRQKDGSHVKKPILLGRRIAEEHVFLNGWRKMFLGDRSALAPQDTHDDIITSAREAQRIYNDTFLTKLVPSEFHGRPLDEEDNDFRLDDGRLVCLPPDEERAA